MKRFHVVTGTAAVSALLMADPRPARADIAIGGDFDVGLPVVQSTAVPYLSTGAGFDFRLGYRFRIPYQLLWITPELAAGYIDLDANIVRIRPGVRVAFGRFVIPYAYTHLGWGWASYDPLGTSDRQGKASFLSAGGLTFDAGAGVDFAVLRRLSVGAHLGYNVVDVGQVDATHLDWRAKWISIGLDATFHF
jgi:hypothetical protein